MAHYGPGKYRAKVVGQVLADGGEGKHPSLQLTIEILAKYEGTRPDPIDAQFSRVVYLHLTEATLGTIEKPGFVLETLRFLGFDGTSFGELDPETPGAWSAVGQEVDVLCKHKPSQKTMGKTVEEWSVLRGGEMKPAAPLDKKGVRDLDARFGKLLRKGSQVQQPARTAPVRPAPVPPAQDDEEDIPF